MAKVIRDWDQLRFASVSWDVSDEDLENAFYAAEAWADGMDAVITFEEIRVWFDGWDQSEEDDAYSDVHDYIRDCLGNGFHMLEGEY